LGLPGFYENTKQKGKMIKEAWGMLSSTLDVQTAMMDLEKRQEKGEVAEEEMEKLNKDLVGKVCKDSFFFLFSFSCDARVVR
jgi:hypothetical protein